MPKERSDPTRKEYAQVFVQNPQGAYVLEHLTRRFCRAPQLSGGIDGIRVSDFRAGARSVIEYIVNRANLADDTPEEPTP